MAYGDEYHPVGGEGLASWLRARYERHNAPVRNPAAVLLIAGLGMLILTAVGWARRDVGLAGGTIVTINGIAVLMASRATWRKKAMLAVVGGTSVGLLIGLLFENALAGVLVGVASVAVKLLAAHSWKPSDGGRGQGLGQASGPD